MISEFGPTGFGQLLSPEKPEYVTPTFVEISGSRTRISPAHHGLPIRAEVRSFIPNGGNLARHSE
jgi:hypothetical protein